MSRTITAMFDSRREAEAAREQLRSELGAEAQIIDKSSSGSRDEATGDSQGFWSDLKDMFVADEDRSSYEEGVNRGAFLLCANVPEEQADRACNLLEQAGSIDFQEREQQWRSQGWSGNRDRRETFARDEVSGERGNIVEEERIPIVEEQLRVGKREEQRGGARVRSYIEERPVSENVNLREEHVHVERRPVDEVIAAADLDRDLLRERNVEMRETAEQPVVSKEARIKEEVVVQKTADERTERVEDTVRNTKVDVDEARGEDDRSALFDRDSDELDREPREREVDPSTSSRH
jgi:stress response protein YsnF